MITDVNNRKNPEFYRAQRRERYLRNRDEILAKHKATREKSKQRQRRRVIPILPKPSIVSPIKQPLTSLEDLIDSVDFQTAAYPPLKQETLFDESNGMSFSEEPQSSLQDLIDSVDFQTAAYPPIKQETLFDESNGMSFSEEPQTSLRFPGFSKRSLFYTTLGYQ